tara:strand:+ start:650 stop:922 length:273 start_codon:yes stop_codon:yes gene_type:complete
MSDTKIVYKKNKVILTMDSEYYQKLLDGYNNLKDATDMLLECSDLYISNVGELNRLQFRMYSALGFCKPTGGCYGCDAVLSNNPNAEVKK